MLKEAIHRKMPQFVESVEVEKVDKNLFTSLFYRGYNGDEPRIMGGYTEDEWKEGQLK